MYPRTLAAVADWLGRQVSVEEVALRVTAGGRLAVTFINRPRYATVEFGEGWESFPAEDIRVGVANRLDHAALEYKIVPRPPANLPG